MIARVDLVHNRFSKLLVLGRATNVGKKTAWSCLCDCGNISIVTTNNLVAEKTKSCGCRKKEASAAKGKANARHNMTNSPTWVSWSAMVYRCTNKNGKQYSTYKGMLCDDWINFEKFYKDMGERPLNYSIDRINVEKGYSLDNCRWASSKTQQNNKTNTRYLNIDGNKVALMIFANKLGIKKTAAQYFYSTLKKINNAGYEVKL